MRSVRLVVLGTLIVIFAALGADAQTVVGGAVGVSNQAAGASDLPYLGRGFGGTAFAAVATIDRDVRRHLSIGGEVSTAAAIAGDQSQRTAGATNAFESRHRDTVFSATAKVFAPIGNRLRVAAAGGAGTAWRRTSREGTTASLFPPASRSPFSETLSNFVFAYTVGADVTFRLAGRVSILALGRIHKLRDDDLQDDGVVRRGVSSTVYRAAVGAQWHF
jgi:hypothetical protein